MSDLLELKKKAKALGLCKEYTDKWDKCENKEGLIKTVLDSNGVEFLCDGVQFRWGLTPKFILENFAEYINGNYLCQNPKGYSVELFCKHIGEIRARSTILVLINCNAEIYIPKDAFVKIYFCASTSARIHNKGKVRIISYGKRNAIGKKWEIEKNVLESEWVKPKE